MAVFRWRGPDVLLLGWIPFQSTVPTQVGLPSTLGTLLLFQSGNDDPPASFQNYQGFASWLHPANPQGSKEYRVACYLEGVEAEFQDGRPPQLFLGGNGSYIGFTPINALSTTLPPPHARLYLAGGGRYYVPRATADPQGEWVQLKYRTDFKLSWLPNVAARFMTGHWAPTAWCETTYVIKRNGEVEIAVQGTAVPNLRLYLEWQVLPPSRAYITEHSMLKQNPANFAGFVQTMGWGCRPASNVVRLGWNGFATAY